MNILITGGAGGIGSTLGYNLYTKCGHKIIIVDNLYSGNKNNLVINDTIFSRFYTADIRDTNKLIDIIQEQNIECIIHMAAITELGDCEENKVECISVNVLGTTSVLEAARITGVRKVIFASTSAVYENSLEGFKLPYVEYDVLKPTLFYSLSKKMAEEVCNSYIKNYNMNINVLRYFNVFGPRQDIYRRSPPLLNYLVKEYINNRIPILYSDGNQQRDYVHINDVCEITALCISAPSGTLNVCSGKVVSVRDIVKAVQIALNTSVEPIYKPAEERWNTYKLFSSEYPLRKDVVFKETNKFALGSVKKLKDVMEYIPSTDIQTLMIDTAKETANLLITNRGINGNVT